MLEEDGQAESDTAKEKPSAKHYEVGFRNSLHVPKLYRLAVKHADEAKRYSEVAGHERRKKQKTANENAERGFRHIGRRIGGGKVAPLQFV